MRISVDTEDIEIGLSHVEFWVLQFIKTTANQNEAVINVRAIESIFDFRPTQTRKALHKLQKLGHIKDLDEFRKDVFSANLVEEGMRVIKEKVEKEAPRLERYYTINGVKYDSEVIAKNAYDRLNQLLDTHSRAKGRNLDYIKNLMRQSYTGKDIITVIETKYADWIDTEFQKYIRPQTLFGPKFDSYLNTKLNKERLSDFVSNYKRKPGDGFNLDGSVKDNVALEPEKNGDAEW